MEKLKILGRNIKKQRSTTSLSQEGLGDLCNLHRTYIGMVERGEKNITILNLLKISNALNVQVNKLLEGLE